MSVGSAKWQTFLRSPPVYYQTEPCSLWKKCFTSTKGLNSTMAANPAVGVVFHWLGGLASGSFYVPYRGVKRWAWETYWLAGISKERVMSPEQQKAAIKEFDLRKGIGVAVLSGVMSACFAYGLAAGDPIKALTLQHGTATLWQGLPVLVVVLIGGFTTNFIWCLILLSRNKTGHQFLSSQSNEPYQHDETIIETAVDAPSREVVERSSPQHGVQVLEAPSAQEHSAKQAPMLANYLLCALAGTTWYFQFFFYTMGETQMGRYKFSSWTIHMASIIIL